MVAVKFDAKILAGLELTINERRMSERFDCIQLKVERNALRALRQ
jgi:hypothetical protein